MLQVYSYIRIFFTIDLILPLLCRYLGEDILCVNLHYVAKVLNALAVNGPLSDQRMSGTAVRQKVCLNAVMRQCVQVFWPI